VRGSVTPVKLEKLKRKDGSVCTRYNIREKPMFPSVTRRIKDGIGIVNALLFLLQYYSITVLQYFSSFQASGTLSLGCGSGMVDLNPFLFSILASSSCIYDTLISLLYLSTARESWHAPGGRRSGYLIDSRFLFNFSHLASLISD
jgi:hypothetical protein